MVISLFRKKCIFQGKKYPSYFRPATQQFVFFMFELGAWDYWHSYDRWVIGPEHNRALGGIMIKPYNPDDEFVIT